MFAPKVDNAQTRAAKNPASKVEPQRSPFAPQPFRGSEVEQPQMLQRSIGNRATRRLLAQRSTNLTSSGPLGQNEHEADPTSLAARGATPGVAWDFSKIPIFAPDRTSQSQASRLLPSTLQPKLVTGQLDDPLEREADRISALVASDSPRLRRKCSVCQREEEIPLHSNPPHSTAGNSVQRKCDTCAREEENRLSRRAVPGTAAEGGIEAPEAVHEVLAQSGQPMDSKTRAYFESRFGFDFSQVRVHADAQAARSARMVGAQAYTVGSHIAFSSGNYSPQSQPGRQLLAHELTHVVQQTRVSAREPALAANTRLQRKPAVLGAASNRVNRLATLLEGYANRADVKLPTLGSASQIAPVKAHLQELRSGIGRLRQLAQQDNEEASQAALSGFAPGHLRTASRVLEPVPTAAPLVAVANETPVGVAAKSLTVDGANTAAEVEADRVAAAIVQSQPVQISAGFQATSVQRLLDEAADNALESELSTIAEETGLEEVAAGSGAAATEGAGAALGAGAAATEEAALGAAAGIAAGGGPPGWVIGLAIVAVVAVAAGAGYLYYRSRQTQPGTKTAAKTETRPVPKECAEQARRLSTPNCRMTATLQHAGNDPLADLFCEEKTNSPCEYRVEAASGRAFFDAISGRDVYECKCGYQSLLDAINRGERWAQLALDEKIEQIRRHLRVSKDCDLQYRIIVSNEAFGKYLRQLFGNEVDVIIEPFEPCD